MVRMNFQVLDLLLAVQHLPALDTEHFAITLLFNRVESVYEDLPFGRITFDHDQVWLSLEFAVCGALVVNGSPACC